MKKILLPLGFGLAVLGVSLPLWSQGSPSGQGGSDSSGGGAMVAPAPVSGEGYSLDFASETTRSNYIRGGLYFGTAYDDDIVSSSSGAAVSDVSYSVSPTIAIDQTRSQLHWTLSYSPGFTFYQKYSTLNQSNQNVAAKVTYRLSPHVTFSAQEVFSKSSGGNTQPCVNEGTNLCGTLQSPNTSIVAPVTDTLTDASSAQLTYQFSPGGMIGVTGNFSELRYPNQSEVPGLYGSSAVGGGAFYTHRLSGKHYIGATYQYQKYLSHADPAQNQVGSATQSHSLMLFYTLYLRHTVSFSLFGGPQYSDTYGPGFPSLHSLSPGGGASLNWQGQHNSLFASYSRRISDGGGLQGAVSYNSADASVRHQFGPALSGTLGGDYSVNRILDGDLLGNSGSGHTLSGTVTLQRPFGEHFNGTAGYSRMHQSYDIAAIDITPNRNRIWLTIGYQFQRSLGR